METRTVRASDEPLVNLVDEQGHIHGNAPVSIAHSGEGQLHEAFSIVIGRNNNGVIEILLQLRSHLKKRFPHVWANSVCSHTLPGENLEDAVKRRLKEELGIECELTECGTFIYKARDIGNDDVVEHEFDHVFTGMIDAKTKVHPNPDEIEETRWVAVETVIEEMQKNPYKFAPWLAQVLSLSAPRLPKAA
jgi:isopentenyl-diphosphate delta-isomerase